VSPDREDASSPFVDASRNLLGLLLLLMLLMLPLPTSPLLILLPLGNGKRCLYENVVMGLEHSKAALPPRSHFWQQHQEPWHHSLAGI